MSVLKLLGMLIVITMLATCGGYEKGGFTCTQFLLLLGGWNVLLIIVVLIHKYLGRNK